MEKILNKGDIYQLIQILLKSIKFPADILKMVRSIVVSVWPWEMCNCSDQGRMEGQEWICLQIPVDWYIWL